MAAAAAAAFTVTVPGSNCVTMKLEKGEKATKVWAKIWWPNLLLSDIETLWCVKSRMSGGIGWPNKADGVLALELGMSKPIAMGLHTQKHPKRTCVSLIVVHPFIPWQVINGPSAAGKSAQGCAAGNGADGWTGPGSGRKKPTDGEMNGQERERDFFFFFFFLGMQRWPWIGWPAHPLWGRAGTESASSHLQGDNMGIGSANGLTGSANLSQGKHKKTKTKWWMEGRK
jgi:hypothetical protein